MPGPGTRATATIRNKNDIKATQENRLFRAIFISPRRPYRREYARVKRQREWLIELARLLDPEKARRYHRTARQVKQRVKRLFARLERETAHDATDASVVRHIVKTLRNRWWGLFTCYRVPQLPATNSEHEVFFNNLKQRQRRVTGRKSV